VYLSAIPMAGRSAWALAPGVLYGRCLQHSWPQASGRAIESAAGFQGGPGWPAPGANNGAHARGVYVCFRGSENPTGMIAGARCFCGETNRGFY